MKKLVYIRSSGSRSGELHTKRVPPIIVLLQLLEGPRQSVFVELGMEVHPEVLNNDRTTGLIDEIIDVLVVLINGRTVTLSHRDNRSLYDHGEVGLSGRHVERGSRGANLNLDGHRDVGLTLTASRSGDDSDGRRRWWRWWCSGRRTKAVVGCHAQSRRQLRVPCPRRRRVPAVNSGTAVAVTD